MSEVNKDELIEAQKEVIGILFEIVKRLQSNNELDEEYLQLLSSEKGRENHAERLNVILKEREENGKIVSRLLDKLKI